MCEDKNGEPSAHKTIDGPALSAGGTLSPRAKEIVERMRVSIATKEPLILSDINAKFPNSKVVS